MPEYTKNPLIRVYAEIRYRVGNRLKDYLYERKLWDGKFWGPIFEWAYNSEGRYNCLIEPLLGKTIKWESKEMRATRKGAALYRAGQKKRAMKYFEKSSEYQDRKDVYLKMRFPEHVTRLERNKEIEEHIKKSLAGHEKKD